MINENGVYLGINTNSEKPTMINLFDAPKFENALIFGKTGSGRGYHNKVEILKLVQLQHIANNHLNNNNWLKMHGKPMVRKGHPYYAICKENKELKPFKIELACSENEEKEYENLLKIFTEAEIEVKEQNWNLAE